MAETEKLSDQDSMYETLSIMQHHDAITGTHEKVTGLDYLSMMDE